MWRGIMEGKKKEALTKFHRDTILAAAEQLFQKKGIERTTMDDIAKASEYSKATLYVYFKNKEEIVSAMTLNSMTLLENQLRDAIYEGLGIKEKFFSICKKLTLFYEEHPIEFVMLLEKIQVNIDTADTPSVMKEIFFMGEKINELIKDLILSGMEEGVIRKDIEPIETLLMLWASITGVILLANKKEEYMTDFLRLSKEKFLESSFKTIFRSIEEKS